MVIMAGLLVRRDVGIHQPGFLSIDLHVSFFQADLPGPDGLDLTAMQHQPCFDLVV